MQDEIAFVLNGKIEHIRFGEDHRPTDTLLNYLRKGPCTKGVKEGCAEGDCGACTVVLAELNADDRLRYKAIDSCLVFLPMLEGKQVITVENLSETALGETKLHPVQEAMVETNGSQCGYCTPGIVMSMFALYKTSNHPDKAVIEDALTGNLCRCTGYKPIIEATAKACVHEGKDQFTEEQSHDVALLRQLREQSKSKEIKTAGQSYFQPHTKAEALALKKKYPEAIVLTGATDVALRVTKRHETLTQIIDLSQVQELKKAVISDYYIKLGAGLSLEQVKRIAEHELPALYDLLAVFGSKQIRELATLGGNIGSSSPISDTLPLLMVYDAEIKLQHETGERRVNMNDYILGYRQTVRKPEELITTVIIPRPQANTQYKFYKVSKRKDLDISTLSAAFSLTLNGNLVENIRMAYGGMAAVTKRVIKAENFLHGKPWDRKYVEEAMEIIGAEFTPISDARSGAEFRTAAAKNLLLKFWSETALPVIEA